MIIKSLELNNFRQFYGTNTIKFATSKKAHITIIHGENGSGKTTILQSFGWVLYGEADLPDKEFLLNKSIFNDLKVGESSKVVGTLEFEHNKNNYILTREQSFQKINARVCKLTTDNFILKHRKQNGETDVIKGNDKLTKIEEFMPKKLFKYFFFDGERINHLGDNDNAGKKELAEAVKTLMGLNFINNAVIHMGGETGGSGVVAMFEKELNKSSNSKLADLLRKVEKDRLELEEKTKAIIEKRNNLEQLEDSINVFNQKISAIKPAKDLGNKRLIVDKRIETNRKLLEGQRLIAKTYLSSNSFANFLSKDILTKAKCFLTDYKIPEKMISGININTLIEIIGREKCICGTDVTEGSAAHKCLVDLKQFVPPQSYGVMVKEFSNKIDRGVSAVDSGKHNTINNVMLDYSSLVNSIEEDSKESAGISKQLQEFNQNHVRDLEVERTKLVEIKKHISDYDLPLLISRDKDLIKLIANSEKEINQLAFEDQANRLTLKRIEVCKFIYDDLKKYRKNKALTIRNSLISRVQSVFQNIIRKDYTMKIDEDYEFFVVDKLDGLVPLSEGERQIASLSFIGALVDLARQDLTHVPSEESVEMGAEIYPLVMDSAFGALDSEYRQKTSQYIPRLAGQVIIFASSTQWRGEVENEIRSQIGAAYDLKILTVEGEIEKTRVISLN